MKGSIMKKLNILILALVLSTAFGAGNVLAKKGCIQNGDDAIVCNDSVGVDGKITCNGSITTFSNIQCSDLGY